MFPMVGRSHYLVLARIGKELESRGHKVLIIVGDCEKFAAKDPRVRTFKCSDDFTKLDPTKIDHLVKCWSYSCDAILSNPDVMKQVKSSDAVIGDAAFQCSYLVADKFSLPHVTVLMSPLSTGSVFPLNFAQLPSYIPHFTSGFTDHMNFLQRVKNTLLYLSHKLMVPSLRDNVYGPLKKKYNITPEKTLHETYQKVDLILVQSDPLDYPRFHLPNTKLVGPLLSSPAKPLPDDLQQFVMGSGDEGVILVSFGSILSQIDDQTIERMAAVFSSLPQRVVWKLNTEGKSLHLGDNVKVSSWLPQNDILGHPKTRLFIGHAGMNGMLEAAYHGVPMICVPFFGDQFDNSAAVKHFGMGEFLYKESITEESLGNLIQTVLNNPSYRDNAGRISRSIKLLPRSAIEAAADWVEYAQALGDLSFLRPRSLDLPFYQLYLLDVLALFLLLSIIVVAAVYLVLRCLYRFCFSKRPMKEKPN
ncbi:2-hydroxyacylsphingosine 1-beta-galactosyltransferase [Stylophora pistillata]|uniref:UDP-glucuronosyltransferase n=2 Tax=Stylophora pistillata TaxID=50429 RepID=A0A2B4S294_STYPI|nr:2-hydroxyacylsphingosine 1-beta-galactosyltransferase [Stylophora pistillata]